VSAFFPRVQFWSPGPGAWRALRAHFSLRAVHVARCKHADSLACLCVISFRTFLVASCGRFFSRAVAVSRSGHVEEVASILEARRVCRVLLVGSSSQSAVDCYSKSAAFPFASRAGGSFGVDADPHKRSQLWARSPPFFSAAEEISGSPVHLRAGQMGFNPSVFVLLFGLAGATAR